MALRLTPVVFFISACLASATSPFDESLDLQHKGNIKEAREVLLSAASAFRASSDQANLAKALSLASQLSLSLGDYQLAISGAQQAAAIREKIPNDTRQAEDLNTLGLAYLYLGNYDAALSNYQRALSLDRTHGNAEGQITRLNNIGNVYFFQGRYTEAMRSYETAMAQVSATAAETWNPRRRQLTLANMAALYQRIGEEQTALTLYRQLTSSPQAISRVERAQFLLNQGVLYRRLGDPIKALDLYRQSQVLFASDLHPDGEIGALRNIGIARAVDLDDLTGALDAFTAALQLAIRYSNVRGIAQIHLYRAEVLRRLHRVPEAESAARSALEASQKSGLAEEHWKAEYGLGKIAEDRGEDAVPYYEQAITEFELIRARALTSLRTEFLADKRDVYDSLIAVRLQHSPTDVNALFSWIERSRSRTFVERMAGTSSVSPPALAAIQSRISPGTVLLDFWIGATSSATVWITTSAAGVVVHPKTPDPSQVIAAVANNSDHWRDLSRTLGRQLLAGVPLREHVIIIPDGLLSALPFELLIDPSSGSLLIEKHDVSYLPAAQFLLAAKPPVKWMAPWRRQLVGFADPPISSAYGATEQWQRLPASGDEVKEIARLLPGRSELHLGVDARKAYLLQARAAGVPLLHFSTHAMVDEQNQDRSRVLLAGDYLFEGDVYGLDLHGVDLATLSACDTARGKFLRGEGVEAFSRAFLAAGSAATVTSLWRVADQPTADFMKQFYYYLARGQTKAAALRSAKLSFLSSKSPLANPRYWAAFVLNGDGWNPARRAIPWAAVAAGILLALGLISAVLLRLRRG